MPFSGVTFSAMFENILCFLLVTSLLKMTPKYNPEVLPGVVKHKNSVLYLMEKIHVLEKLCSGLSYNDVGLEVNVNEPTICSK